MINLTDQERAVLETFKRLSNKDPEGSWACFSHDISSTRVHQDDHGIGSFEADDICRNLRRHKLLNGDGRGRNSFYWISDKGRKVLNGS
jgi:hypothetical protein